jgi:hypothetical protein
MKYSLLWWLLCYPTSKQFSPYSFHSPIYFISVGKVEAVKSDAAAVVVAAVIAEAALLHCELWWQLQGLF